MLGAFVVYFLIYREKRIIKFLKNPKNKWRIFVFDLIGYLICGGLVSCFVIAPPGPDGILPSIKEAFMAGCTWEGVIGGAIAGTELRIEETIEQVRR